MAGAVGEVEEGHDLLVEPGLPGHRLDGPHRERDRLPGPQEPLIRRSDDLEERVGRIVRPQGPPDRRAPRRGRRLGGGDRRLPGREVPRRGRRSVMVHDVAEPRLDLQAERGHAVGPHLRAGPVRDVAGALEAGILAVAAILDPGEAGPDAGQAADDLAGLEMDHRAAGAAAQDVGPQVGPERAAAASDGLRELRLHRHSGGVPEDEERIADLGLAGALDDEGKPVHRRTELEQGPIARLHSRRGGEVTRGSGVAVHQDPGTLHDLLLLEKHHAVLRDRLAIGPVEDRVEAGAGVGHVVPGIRGRAYAMPGGHHAIRADEEPRALGARRRLSVEGVAGIAAQGRAALGAVQRLPGMHVQHPRGEDGIPLHLLRRHQEDLGRGEPLRRRGGGELGDRDVGALAAWSLRRHGRGTQERRQQGAGGRRTPAGPGGGCPGARRHRVVPYDRRSPGTATSRAPAASSMRSGLPGGGTSSSPSTHGASGRSLAMAARRVRTMLTAGWPTCLPR